MRAIINNINGRTRRIVVIGALITVMLISFILGRVIVHARNNSSSADMTPYYTNVTVRNGETLWSIAEQYIDYGASDSIYDYMEQLSELNHLTSDNVYEGQKLVVVYYQHDRN